MEKGVEEKEGNTPHPPAGLHFWLRRCIIRGSCVCVCQIYMYNSQSRTSREISLNSSLEAIYVHHMLPDTTYTIQMSAVTRNGVGVRSQLIVIGITARIIPL